MDAAVVKGANAQRRGVCRNERRTLMAHRRPSLLAAIIDSNTCNPTNVLHKPAYGPLRWASYSANSLEIVDFAGFCLLFSRTSPNRNAIKPRHQHATHARSAENAYTQ